MSIHLLWLLVLFVRNFQRETANHSAPEGLIYDFYEVTIPRPLTPKSGQQESQNVTYLLSIEGKRLVIQLRQQKDLIPKQLPIFTYSKNGNLQLDYPFFRDDCYYHGVVKGEPFSVAIISTCLGGLRGLLQFENETYEIAPIRASTTFQHAVFRLDERAGAIQRKCGLTQEEQRRQNSMISKTGKVINHLASIEDWWSHTRHAKIAVVVDHERYLRFDKNVTLTAIHVLDILFLEKLIYEPLSVHLSIVGLEIWSERNLIPITSDIYKTLQKFSTWRRDSLIKRLPNDAGHLFAYETFDGLTGLAYLGMICDDDRGAGVESYVSSSLLDISNTFAHELGHNLGMEHDGPSCHCDRSKCIMAPMQEKTDRFSNCSFLDYFRLKLRNPGCLLVPAGRDTILKIKFCGNKVVDSGEQCDCGSEVQCASDPCCQSDCMLRSGATCAFGLCCQICQYRQAGAICRGTTSSCDLPEFCNGTSEWCPEDVYVQDGTPCSDGAYCYHGKCTTHDTQCKTLFGGKARVASEVCFRHINIQRDRFGNCGLENGTYKECISKNFLCGRIQCENVETVPVLDGHYTIISTSIGNQQCWGTDYHSGMEMADIGAVRDGTPCGKDMMCIERQCVNMSVLKHDCDVKKCHNRGVCNSLKNCHCDYGWAPPSCQSKGHGGSINSGPPPQQYFGRSVRDSEMFVGPVYAISAALICAGLAVCFRNRLMHQVQILRRRIHSTESRERQDNSKT